MVGIWLISWMVGRLMDVELVGRLVGCCVIGSVVS